MKSSRSKRQRLMPSYVSLRPRPDLPARFESLNDDTLTTILQFVGDKSYATYARINKHCKEIYVTTEGMTKETFTYGYAPLSVIKDRIPKSGRFNQNLYERVGKGVVFYNRRDVLDWALEQQNKDVLNRIRYVAPREGRIGVTDLLHNICYIAEKEGRVDILDKVWNNIDDENERDIFFAGAGSIATYVGKLDVLKWIETKGLYFNKKECASEAAHHGQLHILEWLREEKGLQLFGRLYYKAIEGVCLCFNASGGGDQLYVLKWLRDQKVDWDEYTFKVAAQKGNLNILQWLHDEGCPWPYYLSVDVEEVMSEVIEWLRTNGYHDKVFYQY